MLDRSLPINGGESTFGPSTTMVAIGVMACVGVVGVAAAPSNAQMILGFCGVVIVQLLAILNQQWSDIRKSREAAALRQEVLDAEVNRVAEAKAVAEKVAEAAVKVEKATINADDKRTKTSEKLDDLSATARRTEVYCNSVLGRVLRVAAIVTAASAAVQKTPESIAAAEIATKELREHEEAQKKIDEEAMKKDVETIETASASPVEVTVVNPPSEPVHVVDVANN